MRYRHELYYNLHKHCLSVRNISTGRDMLVPADRSVIHCRAVLLHDATFAVQPAGHAKARATGVKNVHAFVRGSMDYFDLRDSFPVTGHMWESMIEDVKERGIEVTYNPYKYNSFVNRATLAPIYSAPKVYVEGRNIYALTY